MPLYHFSEEPNIEIFVPRPPLAHPEQEPLVWAIDDWHQAFYFVPRDCPRVCFWPQATTTNEDRVRFFGEVAGRMVIAVEWAWMETLRRTTLYRYTMPEETFAARENGMYVSRATVTPVCVEAFPDLIAQLRAADVELRFCSSLVALGQAVIHSTMNFSLIRMRNAQGWE